MSFGISAKSAPALIAVSAASFCVIAPMFSASVTATCSKPTSLRRASYTSGLRSAGSFSFPGNAMWPTMTNGTPTSAAFLNGSNSVLLSFFSDFLDTGKDSCESTVSEPWPGKCLAAEPIPALLYPFTAAATVSLTEPGLSPADRTLIAGSFAPTVTSATGAKSIEKPASRSSAPCAWVALVTVSLLRTAPPAMSGGNGMVAERTRATGPPSWSTEVRTGQSRSLPPSFMAEVVALRSFNVAFSPRLYVMTIPPERCKRLMVSAATFGSVP